MVIAIAKGMVIVMTISMSFFSMASMAKNGTGEQAAHDVEAHDEKEAHVSASDRTNASSGSSTTSASSSTSDRARGSTS